MAGKSSQRPAPEELPEDHGDDEEPRPSKLWVGVAVAAIVALTVVLIVTSRSDPSAGRTGPLGSSTAPASPSVSVNPSEASVCGLTDVVMSGTVEAAPPTSWSMIGTMAAPSIAGQGPGATDSGGYRSCFSRTPIGALLAAANYVAIDAYAPWRRKFYERAIVPGPGRDARLKQPISPESGYGTAVQIAGFTMVSYTGQAAVVDIAMEASDGSQGAKLMSLKWSGGDWKVLVRDNGQELNPVRDVGPEDNFIAWSSGL